MAYSENEKTKVVNKSIKDIKVNPNNPRVLKDEKTKEEIAASEKAKWMQLRK